MQNRLNTYNAGDLMDVLAVTPIPGLPSRFDIHFKVKKGLDIKTPGVYAVFFRHQLIYIGKFQGAKSDPFGSCVIAMRWVKHIATITMRGKRISMANKTIKAIEQGVAGPLASQAILNKETDLSLLKKDRGCVAPITRVAFAFERDDFFGGVEAIESTLENFSFVYLEWEKANPTSIKTIRKSISGIEDRLINTFRPQLNVKGIKEAKESLNIDIPTYTTLVSNMLLEKSTHRLVSASEDRNDFESLSSATNIPAVVEYGLSQAINWIDCETDWIFYFTKEKTSGVFRVAIPGKKPNSKLVLATATWQTKNKVLLVHTRFDVAFPDLECRLRTPNTLPFEYRLKPDLLGEGVFTELLQRLKNNT